MTSRSLVTRLVLVQQALLLAAMMVFAGSSLWLTAHVLEREQHAFLADTADRLLRTWQDERQEQPDPFRSARETLSEGASPGIAIEIDDAAGRLLAATRRPATRAADGAQAELQASARDKSGGVVHARMSRSLLDNSLRALAFSLLVAAGPLLVVGMLATWWVSRRALRPLSAMAARAASLPVEGGPRSLGEPTHIAELDQLQASFDRLLGRLDDALRAERQFTADASHELRTPLTVLSGELELANGAGPGLARASAQVRAMRELVDALLLLRRVGPGGSTRDFEFEPVNLADVLREELDGALARHPARVPDVRLEAPDEVLVHGHPTLLQSAVRNLVDNALKFTREGERVDVRACRAGAEARLTVEDAGAGVPAGDRERVFDAFYRGGEARAAQQGFGLGLPILRRVARAHGGDVVLDGSPLGGARFELRLPALAET